MRRQDAGLQPVYIAAERFRDRCLSADDSLFTPGVAIWTAPNLTELIDRFVNHPDTSSDRFIDKFRRQLDGTSDQVVQLAAEAIYVHFLIADNVGGEVKRDLVTSVLSWARQSVVIPTDLDAPLDTGLANAGAAFNMLRPFQISYLLRFCHWWKTVPVEERQAGLADPSEFKRMTDQVPVEHGAFAQRDALLHLVHPEGFEPIVSRRMKDDIVRSFADLVPPDLTDIDARLRAIREALSKEHGSNFSFWDEPIASEWRTHAAERARRFVKIATGQAAKYWPDDLDGGFAAVEWDRIGDLRKFAGFDAFREQFAREYAYQGNPSAVTRKAHELWTMRELEPGDVVVANDGETKVLGVGTVVEPAYEWMPDRGEAQHVVHVEWDTTRARRVPPIGAWRMTTVRELTPEQVRLIVMGGAAYPAISASDFELLKRYQDSKPWNSLPLGDQTSLGLLRRKVREYAEHLASDLMSTARLVPFVSILNPNGRSPKDYWGCLYPGEVGNKSYAFQIFLIVGPEGVEFVFGAGSGESQVRDTEKTAQFSQALEEARRRLGETRGAQWWPQLDEEIRKSGLAYRRGWRDHASPPLAGYDEWLALASGSTARGAPISAFIDAPTAASLGRTLADRVVSTLRPLMRLMDAVYGTGSIVQVPEPGDGVSLEALAKELSLDSTYLQDVQWLLEDQRQVIFYGPPGTGKTYVAEAFAAWFAGDPNRVEIVQFHPSYAYEDFVEGIRPDLEGRELRYRLVPGILRRVTKRATDDPDKRPYVLIVDEINRANIARVFGELLYLLEYRRRSVTLPYSQESYSIPANLYLVGTMNTADRSIALVDFALRRRFQFVHFPADVEILRRWLNRWRPQMAYVADYLEWVNARIGSQDFAVGFSYFMRKDLDEDLLELIWAHSVVPSIEEYFFGDTDAPRSYSLEQVHNAVNAANSQPAADVDWATAAESEDAP